MLKRVLVNEILYHHEHVKIKKIKFKDLDD
jgi:hypothetical protein